MNRKAQYVAEQLADTVSRWEGVDTVTLGEAAMTEIYDPYFALSLDVYYRGTLPGSEARREIFSESGAFETSGVHPKDRFLMGDLPVRMEYKNIPRLDDLIDRSEELLWAFRETGTYMFYRLENGRVLKQSSDWLESVRRKISTFPDRFWNLLREAFQYRMEHYLSDLSASVMRDDPFFYLASSAGFMRSVCSVLFALNHRFEPSGRMLYEQTLALPDLPDNFPGLFESFLRPEQDMSPSRKREVAQLITRGIIAYR